MAVVAVRVKGQGVSDKTGASTRSTDGEKWLTPILKVGLTGPADQEWEGEKEWSLGDSGVSGLSIQKARATVEP